ncbi:methylmalonyl-CoA mutase family protein [Phenylobacterium sp.]|uniref:methylmalonyl-CoA mutase family protein n=1 Tax=Phenylobacterium sp. TaxID=1871053 RepID=UPI0027320E13|nr:methylmalonyl-CoA mutase family protein [Phenylobacterium sp.]MDP2212713.1 methylmalonyl-CoA mutase family protein [Phenylobacterium sp.]
MVQNASPAVEFPPASAEDWRALVLKTLGDRPPESLTTTTADGLTIAPLYGAGAGGPVPSRPFDPDRAWDLRGVTRHPDPARANADILADLEGGAASVLIGLDPTGEAGVAAGSTEDLARVLQGVILELAPVALDAGFLGTIAADWLSGVAKASPGALLRFHLDPLSAFAQSGASPGPIEAHLFAAAGAAARHALTYPQAQLFLASGAAVHEAGGGAACEVAFAAASALAYAKAMVRAGMAMDEAFARITLGLAAEADYFLTIAKLRAARLVWARLTGACGLDVPARIEARSSRRMLTRRDPWTNMLRLTSAGFGAAVGGADAIVLGAFTDALGRPSPLARRQSRNTQLVLMEEAHIARVTDPAAGSGYVEALTDQIARAAWSAFQVTEGLGGVVSALTAGHIAAEVETTCAARADLGEPAIVGVTAFPPAKDEPVEVDTVPGAPVTAPSPRLPGPDGRCPPLAPQRLSEPFETPNAEGAAR